MTPIDLVFLDVVVILSVAKLLGEAAFRTGQPRVIGEIVACIALGPTLLGRVGGPTTRREAAPSPARLRKCQGTQLEGEADECRCDHRGCRPGRAHARR